MGMRPPAAGSIALGLVLAAAAGAVAAVGTEASSEAPRTVEDHRRGYSVALPAGWDRARRNLTPQLVEPREILSVATYPLPYRRRARCGIPGCPTPALNGFRANDVLVSIQERVQARPARKDVPIDLNPRDVDYSAGPGSCTRGKVEWYAFDFFAAGGRSFYAFVVVGERAPASARRDLRRVLDSLRFAPRDGPS